MDVRSWTLARVTGKDGQAGRLASQLTGRLAHMQERLSALEIKKHYAMSFWLDGSSSPRKQLFTIPAGTIDLDGVRRIIFPDLTMMRCDRVAITGANGLGKKHADPACPGPAYHSERTPHLPAAGDRPGADARYHGGSTQAFP
ncbi:MAG: hypothetical protein AB2L14_36070 [Candidatus Xenobiia bacterium LiM19]